MSADPSVPHSYDDEDQFADEHDHEQTPEYPDRDDAQVTVGTNRLGTETAYHAHHGRDNLGHYPDEARARAALWDHENSGGSKGYFPNHWVDGHLDTSNDRASYEKDPHSWLSKNSPSYAKETENDAGDMVDDAMEGSEHLKGLLTDNKIGPTKYSSTGLQTCVHCQKPIEEGMGGAWVDEHRSTGDYRTNHLHEPAHGYLDAMDNIERAFKDTSHEDYDALAENMVGPTKYSSYASESNPCNCEHEDHFDDEPSPVGRSLDRKPKDRTAHGYGEVPAGSHRAEQVGAICDECANGHLKSHVVSSKTAADWETSDCDCPGAKKIEGHTKGEHSGWAQRMNAAGKTDGWGHPIKQGFDGHGAWDCNNYDCPEHPQSMYDQKPGEAPGWLLHDSVSPAERDVRKQVNDATSGSEWLLDQQHTGPTKFSSRLPVRTAAVPNDERDVKDMSGNCEESNHDACEDYPDTNCLCECHDHHGVPAKYKTGWEDDQYYPRPFKAMLRQIEAGVSPLDPSFGKTAGFDVEIPGSTHPMPSPDQATTKPRQMPSDTSVPFSENDPNNAESVPSQGGPEEGGDGIDSEGIGQDQQGKFASMVGYVIGSNPGITIDEAKRVAANALRVETTRKQA